MAIKSSIIKPSSLVHSFAGGTKEWLAEKDRRPKNVRYVVKFCTCDKIFFKKKDQSHKVLKKIIHSTKELKNSTIQTIIYIKNYANINIQYMPSLDFYLNTLGTNF